MKTKTQIEDRLKEYTDYKNMMEKKGKSVKLMLEKMIEELEWVLFNTPGRIKSKREIEERLNGYLNYKDRLEQKGQQINIVLKQMILELEWSLSDTYNVFE